jgi:hypothetical protein
MDCFKNSDPIDVCGFVDLLKKTIFDHGKERDTLNICMVKRKKNSTPIAFSASVAKQES